MKKEFCKLKEKLEKDIKLSRDDIKMIMNIVRKQMNFMIKNNIVITPKNYERWFYVFCNIIENNKELNDLEILGLFKEIYDAPYDEIKEKAGEDVEIKQKGMVKKLVRIADIIEQKLSEVINTLDSHNNSIDSHKNEIVQDEELITDEKIKNILKKILDELEMLRRENEFLTNELRKYHADVVRLQGELLTARTEAEIDFLTGLVNRRRFERALLEMINDYQNRGYPFALIYLDIDNFKSINDKYGHPSGDQVLKEIALILKTFLRANNIAARVGGEEFAILVPGATAKEGEIVAERLRNVIAQRTFSTLEDEIHVTASFGVTGVRTDDTIDTIFARVDKAMYDAKNSGKNRVVVVE
ncbi:diguanylate cyclase/phosphodiesterase [Nitratiruptor sp. YY08-26]|uniref:GGDEF domain-containing protein n=1 Tax=unclassified Nitratiruptor TaxID=2624044 RepID=UPI00191608A2|nr:MULTISPECIES: GGDEF domain-containing protein [unclassified Nitratiruptor]BCD62759.1 diguanylate cyclase/phosphodiesterase [Nitratiruptor sp. YY08-13]BCD66695.1 diguanylate cyclase/phosphodiesterase [Nitratiruptor sp. YY08-26]